MLATLVAAASGVSTWAAENRRDSGEHTVTVCLSSGSISTWPAEAMASEIFAGIGVKIQWHIGTHGCPPQAIVINMSIRTPENLKPGSLACALPFEGVHIYVFYDRIEQDRPKNLIVPLLAHVLVHEITHILEGYSRHSETGMMKAHWGHEDMEEMELKPLAFAAEDVDLIDRGLAARNRMLAATSEPVAPAVR